MFASEVDYELQKRVASLFSNAAVVNQRLPSFIASADRICDRWVGRPAASPARTWSRRGASMPWPAIAHGRKQGDLTRTPRPARGFRAAGPAWAQSGAGRRTALAAARRRCLGQGAPPARPAGGGEAKRVHARLAGRESARGRGRRRRRTSCSSTAAARRATCATWTRRWQRSSRRCARPTAPS